MEWFTSVSNFAGTHVLSSWKRFGKLVDAPKGVDDSYISNFQRANLTFLYQRVYDPRLKQIVYLTPPRDADKHIINMETDFIGPFIEPHVARGQSRFSIA